MDADPPYAFRQQLILKPGPLHAKPREERQGCKSEMRGRDLGMSKRRSLPHREDTDTQIVTLISAFANA